MFHCIKFLSISAPPLRVDNVLAAVQGVHRRTLGEALLLSVTQIFLDDKELLDKIKRSDDDRLHAVVKTWVQGAGVDKITSWRHLVWRLDHGDMTESADKFRHFAEPLLGKSCDSIRVSIFLYRSSL